MKKLIFFILPLALVISSCSKEYIEDDADVMLKKSVKANPVERPMYAWFSSDPDFSAPLMNGLPSAGYVKGHATHIGKVDQMKSRWTLEDMFQGPGSGQVTEVMKGTITGAHGDSFEYTSVMIVQLPAMTFTATVTMDGGTGRFVDAYGVVEMEGAVTNGIPSWTGVGTITY